MNKQNSIMQRPLSSLLPRDCNERCHKYSKGIGLDGKRRVKVEESGKNSGGCRYWRPLELHALSLLCSFVGGVSGKRRIYGLRTPFPIT